MNQKNLEWAKHYIHDFQLLRVVFRLSNYCGESRAELTSERSREISQASQTRMTRDWVDFLPTLSIPVMTVIVPSTTHTQRAPSSLKWERNEWTNPARWPFDFFPKLIVDWVSIYLLRAEKLTILRIRSVRYFLVLSIITQQLLCALRDVSDHNLGRREERWRKRRTRAHNANDYTFAIRLFFIFDFWCRVWVSSLSRSLAHRSSS